MIIAIDGPGGAGKGTIAAYLADHFGCLHLDTGLLYRVLAAKALSGQIDPANYMAIVRLAETVTIAETHHATELRNEAIAAIASRVAVIPEVRTILNQLQRDFCQKVRPPYRGVVLDGRDIGTVVCPEAQCKLFVTARPEIRFQRRLRERPNQSQDQIEQALRERDKRDAERPVAPLQAAHNAFVLDTSDLSISEACAQAAAYVANCFEVI